MENNTVFVSIVIPMFNEERYLAQCLDSIFKLDYPKDRFEVIIVDNGSTDKSIEIANKYNTTVLVKADVKVGAVRNYGVKHSQGEIIVFLDSDCLVEPWWLTAGIRKLQEEDYNAVGGLFLLRDNPAWIERNWILNSSRSFSYQKTFIGACIFIQRAAFDGVDGFNEALNAGEDCYLTEQLIKKGFKIHIDPNLSVIHLGYPQTIGGFLRRQIWHSSDSVKRLSNIINDKTLLLVVVFMSLFLLIPILYYFTDSLYILLATGSLLAFIPVIFSIKRMIRYGVFKIKPNIVSIYLVDILYLVGRSIGFLRGLKGIISFRGTDKLYK